MTSGVYLITNKINGHKYVGGSVNIRRRIQEHKRSDDIKNSAIDKAIAKYGKENFNYQIITILPPDWKIIGKHEKYWIKFYNTFKDKKHYNLAEGGDKPPIMFGNNNPMYNNPNNLFIGEDNPNYNNPTNYKPSKEFLMNISKKKNKSGFYRVSKHKDKHCNQGFVWRYRYTENNKQKEISSINLFDLKDKVEEKDLEWYIVDEDRVKDTIKKYGGSIR